MRKWRHLLLTGLALLLLAMVVPAFAQTQVAAPENPNANISWPPPVYVLRGEFALRGSANLPNMTNYFIEFRQLNDDLTVPDGPEVWFPAVLPSTNAVQDDVLGVWDTTAVNDGIYELRLTVNVRGSQPVFALVSPLRVENELPPFMATATPTVPPPPTATPPPTLTPTPSSPMATVSVANANVRTGDGTNYQIIASLARETSLEILGISAYGTGWYQVRLPNGQIGWMAPSVITVSGNVSSLPRIVPPPPPATPTPAPTATPMSQANLVAGIVVLDPASPSCAQTFNVGFDVANLGSEATAFSGTVSLVDSRAADGSIQGTTIGGFPVLLPGQTFRVNMPLTISTWYNEVHRIVLTIDPSNQIPETNESDNVRTIEYTLAQGACP